ncbi:MAG: aminotransferase class I/II-fold pyridoxal phosphate-dependent enzyme [Actinomycetota bacterium]|nr:aminotransferase class I/II-fold pyridoxal phosphate-dependent enzyme [Actinomycetota bacterium]
MRGRTAVELAVDIERRVVDHELLPGDRLPPVRILATELDLAPNTVAAAYRRLGERGIAIGRGRMGTFIADRPPVMLPTAPEVREGLQDLSSGNPDPDLLPDLGSVLRGSGAPTVLYGDRSVDEKLEQRGARLLTADGVSADHLTVVSGGLDGMERVLQAHLRRGDRVAIEDPGYPAVIDLIGALGYVAVPMAMDDDGPQPDSLDTALDRGVAAVIVTPRAQNPFGSAISAARSSVLRSSLDRFPDVLVIEDDHAAAVAGTSMHSIVGGSERWATIRSAAKTYGPDVRLALLAGDQTTVRRVEGRQRLGPGWVSHVLQRLVARMIGDQDINMGVARAAVLYASRRRAMLEALRERGFEAHGASGLNVWVPVPDEAAVERAMERRGFSIRSGGRFRIRSMPGLRLTVAALDEAEAVHVADALRDAVSDLGTGTRSG